MADPIQHQALSDGPKPFEGSGKDVYKPHVSPIQSIHPTSEQQGDKSGWSVGTDKKDFIKVSDPNLNLDVSPHVKAGMIDYPFSDLKVGEGLYIPVEQNSTTDKLMQKLYRNVANARLQFAEVERDENGNEIWDVVIVKTRKQNEDGTFQMGVDGRPLEGANQTSKPRLVFSRHFAVKAVIKDQDLGDGQKAPHDGALVVRQM